MTQPDVVLNCPFRPRAGGLGVGSSCSPVLCPPGTGRGPEIS
jgi:hypothetical protein